ncbi:hypothetical protein K440DRAFT_615787 [Wilcoxina mikolae CBS 423.85]|nr:hypothetical protein K440DRAFT_615787 [Wilcoxina mikolae CBS 423.85]
MTVLFRAPGWTLGHSIALATVLPNLGTVGEGGSGGREGKYCCTRVRVQWLYRDKWRLSSGPSGVRKYPRVVLGWLYAASSAEEFRPQSLARGRGGITGGAKPEIQQQQQMDKPGVPGEMGVSM